MPEVASSTIVNPETGAQDNDLWGVPSAFIVDWSLSVRVTNQFSTDVKYASSMVSSREGLRGKPKRIVTATVTGLEQEEIKLIRAAMFRQAQARSLCPLYSDQTFLTANVTIGATTLSCDTTFRRFYTGARVLVISPVSFSGKATVYEVLTIQSVARGGVTTTTGAVHAYASGSRVYPLLECRPALTPQMVMEAETVGRWQVAVTEDVGVSQLPAGAASNEAVGGFPTAFGMMILSTRCDWKDRPQLGADRAETTVESGITTVSEMKGLRPVVVGRLYFECLTRGEFWQLYRFWCSCRGRLFPFLIPLPISELLLISIGGSAAAFASTGMNRDWFYSQYVLFEKADGTQLVMKVLSWDRSGSGDLVQFTSAVPGGWTFASIVRVTFAISCCFDSDELVEEWSSDETVSTTLPIREFPFDGNVNITIPDPSTGVDVDPATPTPGDPDDTDPSSPQYQQLQDCNGTLVDLWVPSVPTPPDYLYAPLTDKAYTVVHADVDEADITGDVIISYQEIPYPPDNNVDNPSWVPPCDPVCPDVAGGFTSWYQFAPAAKMRAVAADRTDPHVETASDETAAGALVRSFIYDVVPFYAIPDVTYTAPLNYVWTWDRTTFAAMLGLPDATFGSYAAMTKAQAFLAFQKLWTRTWGASDGAWIQWEQKTASGSSGSEFGAYTAAIAAYESAGTISGVGGLGTPGLTKISARADWQDGGATHTMDLKSVRIKVGLNVSVAAGQKATRFYQRNEKANTSTDPVVATVFDDNGVVSSPYSVQEDMWSQIAGQTTFGSFLPGTMLTDWIGNLAPPLTAADIVNPKDYSYRGFVPYALSSDNIRVLVGFVFRCIIGTPHL
jgi:hypothetical protein